MSVLGTLDGDGKDFVVGEELDRALGPSGGVGDEDGRVTALAAAANLGNPVGKPSTELEGRLAGNVDGWPCLAADFERLERGGADQPLVDVVPTDDEPIRLHRGNPFRDCLVVARLDLLSELEAVRPNFVRFGHENGGTRCRTEVVDDRRATIRLLCTGNQFLQGNDRCAIEGARRTLRRGVVRTNGFDVVADELQTEWLLGAGGVEVHDTTAYAKFSGLVDGILPGVACRRENICQIDG